MEIIKHGGAHFKNEDCLLGGGGCDYVNCPYDICGCKGHSCFIRF